MCCVGSDMLGAAADSQHECLLTPTEQPYDQRRRTVSKTDTTAEEECSRGFMCYVNAADFRRKFSRQTRCSLPTFLGAPTIKHQGPK